jgi:uncharacterized protein (TIGR03435 family)
MARILAVAAVLLASTLAAQEPPRFEVASVRPHRAADDVMFAVQFHEGGRLTATGSVRMLIRTAYRIQELQLEGARGWIDDERFDVDARVGRDATPDEMRAMLRALLRDRFGLVLRTVRRDAPVYGLRIVEPGTTGRLRPASSECPGVCNLWFAPGVLSARGVTTAMLASELSWWVDRIVSDQTGLQGAFDLDLEWTPDVVPQAPGFASSDLAVGPRVALEAPSIFTAVREQLGLSLEPVRGDIDVFVIERVERPAEKEN